MPKLLSSFLAALVGGVIVAAFFLLTDIGNDGGGSTETIVEQTGAAPANRQAGAPSPRAIYKRDAPGVVFIRSRISANTEATGSGFVIGRGGSIVTNAHVVGAAKQVAVQFSDKKVATAKVAGADPSTDLALLLVDPDGLDLHQLALGESKGVAVGDAALAIGNPFGYERTLTTGVISGIGRSIPSLQEGFDIGNVLQTDAAINPGNSGGPLLDSLGRVIGVNSQIRTNGTEASNIGIGFAVPVDTLKEVIPRLRREGSIERAYLGVSTRTIDGSLDALDLPAKAGALVVNVTSGSPADKAGIREGNRVATVAGEDLPIGGDIIVAIDGKPVKTNSEVAELISAKRPGDKVRIDVLRDKQRKTITVTLGKRPTSGA
jgi:S1-C subfamily serine protease